MHRGATAIVILLAVFAQSCTCGSPSPQESRSLSYELLWHGTDLAESVPLSEFVRPANAVATTNRFAGRLKLESGANAVHFKLLVDELPLAVPENLALREFPPFDFEFVQDGERLIPLQQGPVSSEHPWWEFVLQPGFAWDEAADSGFSRAVVPFALKERNADCIHNGLLSFLFNDQGTVSSAVFQISSQTCKYLQFEMHGLLEASYAPGEPASGAAAVTAAIQHRDSQMPQRLIEQLAADYPGIDSRQFGSTNEIEPADMSAFGFVIDGIHYVGGCNTPRGAYPYCDEMALPSYSTAKSLVGGLALMLAEKQYPGIRNTLVTEYIDECRDNWDDVTIEHALDLVTGHYNSSQPHGDEDAAESSTFFLAEDHATKIDYACNAHPQRSPPGAHWSYQTWATYLAGAALNERLKSLAGDDSDFYRDLLVEKLWEPLALSKLISNTRRTYDETAQPFTGYGLTFVRDDVAKLADFLGTSDGQLNGKAPLDKAMFDAIKQRVSDDPGMRAESELIRYNNGFRTFDVSGVLGCKSPTWLTTMSGYGGINIVLMPNDTAYYYFSDGNVHRYLSAVRESHRIRSMCGAM